MATLEKLVVDAKRISDRLNDKLVLGDSLINEIEFVNEQLKTLRTVYDKFDVLNELSRNKSNNYNLAIQRKYPHIKEIQLQNRQLRACIQDYQRTLEHVMTKYQREGDSATQKLKLNINQTVSAMVKSTNHLQSNSK